jgi:hypothetical protein
MRSELEAGLGGCWSRVADSKYQILSGIVAVASLESRAASHPDLTACQQGGGQIQIGSAARFCIYSIRVSLLGGHPACCGDV